MPRLLSPWTTSSLCGHCRVVGGGSVTGEEGGTRDSFLASGSFLYSKPGATVVLGMGLRVFREAITNPILLLNQWEVAGGEGDVFLPS